MSLMRRYSNLKLKNKLMLLNSLLILTTLGILSYVSYRESAKSLNSEVLFSTKQVFEQTDSFLTYKLSKIIDTSDSIAIDSTLNNMLSRPPGTYPLAEQMLDFRDLSSDLSTFQKYDDIFKIRLYIPDHLVFADENLSFFPLSRFTGSDLYPLLSSPGKMRWITDAAALPDMLNSDEPSIHSIRFIKNVNLLDNRIGVLVIDLRTAVLQDIVKRANTTRSGIAYLQNQEGTVIASSNDTRLPELLLDVETVRQAAEGGEHWQALTVREENVLAGAKSIEGTDWTLVSVLPLQELSSSSINVRNQIALVMIILIAVANICSYWISSSVTNRIGMVIRKMRKVQTGDLDTVKSGQGSDEAGQLVENFNYMVNRMKIILEEQYKLGQEAKNAELKALQSQINPHFLYNTLDLINWTAIRHQVPDISTIVQSLCQFYKLSLNNGEEIITLAEELEHARLYMEIQNRRFQNAVVLHMDVDESIADCAIMKITLQPIVENAFLHGIRETEARRGEIFIYSYSEGPDISIVVQDNGAGMEQELVDQLNQGGALSHKGSYGIMNINHRLKLYFGEAYGLVFASAPGRGTSVTIRIPAQKLSSRGGDQPSITKHL
jgi:two-component system, sensor histidine kinase YesM